MRTERALLPAPQAPGAPRLPAPRRPYPRTRQRPRRWGARTRLGDVRTVWARRPTGPRERGARRLPPPKPGGAPRLPAPRRQSPGPVQFLRRGDLRPPALAREPAPAVEDHRAAETGQGLGIGGGAQGGGAPPRAWGGGGAARPVPADRWGAAPRPYGRRRAGFARPSAADADGCVGMGGGAQVGEALLGLGEREAALARFA